jgi:transposase InsO family protein
MDVSVSSYYAWLKRSESQRRQQNGVILEQIKIIHQQSRQSYGSPPVWVRLNKKGICCSENRVAKLMKSHQIGAERKRKFVPTTDSNHDLPVAQNVLNQDFTASRLNEKWVTDITYVWTKEGWLYVAVVLERSAAAVIF